MTDGRIHDWEAVVAAALALPGTALASYYGHLVPKLNGKPLASPGDIADSFVLMIDKDEKALLLDTQPHSFWQTDHYRDYGAILVRYGADADRVMLYLRRRWWDCARRAERTGFGPRP